MDLAARCLIALSAGLFHAAGWAQTAPPQPPPPLRSLSDGVGALTDSQESELSSALQEAFESTGVRIIMVIAATTKPELIEDYAERLARRWTRERALDPTRAVFVIVAVDDREMQVLPGHALRLDTELTDPEIARDLVPLFRERRYFEALTLLTRRLRSVIENGPPQADRRS